MRIEGGTYPEPGGEEFTDGWSGSDASHDRAITDQKTGRAKVRREQTIRALSIHGAAGLTWSELGEVMGWHHGQASGVLSALHKEGRISRLQEKRNRCHVYVMNSVVNGRETREAGRTAANRGNQAIDASDLQNRLTEAAGEAFDRGWQIGYDQAKAEAEPLPSVEQEVRAAHKAGIREGRHEEALRMLQLTTAMRKALVMSHGSRIHQHNKICWMEHPGCTIDSVEKGISRSLPTVPRPREAS